MMIGRRFGRSWVGTLSSKAGKSDNLALDWDSHDEAPVIYERLPDGDPAWEDPGQYRRIYAGGAAGGTEEA